MEKQKFEKVLDRKMDSLINTSDVLVNPESGLAMVVIKPDAFKNREKIIKKLEDSGLYVVATRSRKLSDRFVSGIMYKNLPKSVEEETLKHFNSGPVEIILLKGGNDMVQKVVSITGKKINPTECDIETIRYEFGEHFSRTTNDGGTYFRNAIHRGKDSKEQKEDLEKFKDLL
jgi:nucleoside diphosphate kinase